MTSLGHYHILVIDNSTDILSVMQEILQDEGYRVSLRRFPEPDIRDVAASAPDLIVLDCVADGVHDNWRFVKMLRSDPKTTSIQLLLCTCAVREAGEYRSFLGEIGVHVVLKPFDIDGLLSKIRSLLNVEVARTVAEGERLRSLSLPRHWACLVHGEVCVNAPRSCSG
jgi:DNA-binding response OmpR family regulator